MTAFFERSVFFNLIMAKSTIESLEKLLLKHVTPLSQLLSEAVSEIKCLKNKVSSLEEKLDHKQMITKTPTSQLNPNGALPACKSAKNPVSKQPSNPIGLGERVEQAKAITLLKTRASTGGSGGGGSSSSGGGALADVVRNGVVGGAHATRASSLQQQQPRADAQQAKTQSTKRAPTVITQNAKTNASCLISTERTSDDVMTKVPNELDGPAWTLVSSKLEKRKRNSQRIVVRGTGTIDNELEAAERSRRIHICFLKPETSSEAVTAYMTKSR